jgi:hypothetical protein
LEETAEKAWWNIQQEAEEEEIFLVNVCQQHIDDHQEGSIHLVEVQHPKANAQVCTTTEVRASEHLVSLILENHELQEVWEIWIHCASSGESYNGSNSYCVTTH